MKLYCKDCEKFFEDTEVTDDGNCPFCNKDNVEETFICEDCEDVFPESERYFNEDVEDGFLCEECNRTRKNSLTAKEEYELSEFVRGWENYKS